jgi:hypothetical protein
MYVRCYSSMRFRCFYWLCAGLGTGLLGAVAKPTVAVLDMARTAAHGTTSLRVEVGALFESAGSVLYVI